MFGTRFELRIAKMTDDIDNVSTFLQSPFGLPTSQDRACSATVGSPTKQATINNEPPAFITLER